VKLGLQVEAALAVAPLLFVSGCLSTTLYETARVCPPGTAEMTVASTPFFWRTESTLFVFEQWNRPGPELSVRMGLSEAFGVGVRLILAPGACLTAKYQFLREPIDVALTGAAYGYIFAAADAASGQLGAYGGLLASSERPDHVPFSAQAILRYDCRRVGSAFSGSYSSDVVGASLGAGIPVRMGLGRSGALRIHPAASVNLPLSWRYWGWAPPGDPWQDPGAVLPPTRDDDWRGVVTLDLGIGLSYIATR
jgi:hypothetical protein